MSTWVDFALTRPVRHLSLHFDGIRIDKKSVASYGTEDDPNGEEAFIFESRKAIGVSSSLQVEIAKKTHVWFRDASIEERELAPPHLRCVSPNSALHITLCISDL